MPATAASSSTTAASSHRRSNSWADRPASGPSATLAGTLSR
jgi:hypothetical protein